MKEISAIVTAYNTIDFTTTKAALATVASVEGSSYRRAGARMLVLDNGTYLGGISGGCLEGDALRRAQKAIMQNKASLVTYDTTQDDGAQIGVGLGCNGIIDVLFTPLQGEGNPVELLAGLTDTRTPKVVITVTAAADNGLLGKSWLYEDAAQFGRQFPFPALLPVVTEDVASCLQNQSSAAVSYESAGIKLFIEIILPVTSLVLYGGNYDIYPLLRTAKELGWNTTVVTNIYKATQLLFDTARVVLHNKGGEKPVFDHYTAVVLMAHDYATDLANLRELLNTNLRYIGLLGPRKRSLKMFKELEQQGIVIGNIPLQHIFSPAGLDIGANTPEEIALSICAEIRSVFAGRNGSSLRLRQGTIYGN